MNLDNKNFNIKIDYNLELLSYKINEFEAYLITRNEKFKNHTIRKMYMDIYNLFDVIDDKDKIKNYKIKLKKILIDYNLYVN